MARRSSLPGADELFRTTATPSLSPREPELETPSERERHAQRQPAPQTADEPGKREQEATPERKLSSVAVASERSEASSGRGLGAGTAHRSGSGVRRVSRAKSTDAEHQPSGRERHDEKITVYVSPQELLELERARWVLRAEHGLASDRGRIVREAVAVVLADLEAKGAQSILVTRLQELENG